MNSTIINNETKLSSKHNLFDSSKRRRRRRSIRLHQNHFRRHSISWNDSCFLLLLLTASNYNLKLCASQNDNIYNNNRILLTQSSSSSKLPVTLSFNNLRFARRRMIRFNESVYLKNTAQRQPRLPDKNDQSNHHHGHPYDHNNDTTVSNTTNLIDTNSIINLLLTSTLPHIENDHIVHPSPPQVPLNSTSYNAMLQHWRQTLQPHKLAQTSTGRCNTSINVSLSYGLIPSNEQIVSMPSVTTSFHRHIESQRHTSSLLTTTVSNMMIALGVRGGDRTGSNNSGSSNSHSTGRYEMRICETEIYDYEWKRWVGISEQYGGRWTIPIQYDPNNDNEILFQPSLPPSSVQSPPGYMFDPDSNWYIYNSHRVDGSSSNNNNGAGWEYIWNQSNYGAYRRRIWIRPLIVVAPTEAKEGKSKKKETTTSSSSKKVVSDVKSNNQQKKISSKNNSGDSSNRKARMDNDKSIVSSKKQPTTVSTSVSKSRRSSSSSRYGGPTKQYGQLAKIMKNMKETYNFKGYGLSIVKSMLFKESFGMSFRLPITSNFDYFERHSNILPSITTSVSTFYPLMCIYSINFSINLEYIKYLLSVVIIQNVKLLLRSILLFIITINTLPLYILISSYRNYINNRWSYVINKIRNSNYNYYQDRKWYYSKTLTEIQERIGVSVSWRYSLARGYEHRVAYWYCYVPTMIYLHQTYILPILNQIKMKSLISEINSNKLSNWLRQKTGSFGMDVGYPVPTIPYFYTSIFISLSGFLQLPKLYPSSLLSRCRNQQSISSTNAGSIISSSNLDESISTADSTKLVKESIASSSSSAATTASILPSPPPSSARSLQSSATIVIPASKKEIKTAMKRREAIAEEDKNNETVDISKNITKSNRDDVSKTNMIENKEEVDGDEEEEEDTSTTGDFAATA